MDNKLVTYLPLINIYFNNKMSTNSLIFPEGVTYKQRYITGGDLAPTDAAYTILGNLYRYASNFVIDLKIDTSTITDLSYAFERCAVIAFPLFDTSNVTNMSYMFDYCRNLKYVPLFDTSNVTSMERMFEYCDVLTSVPLFDTSNVISMYYMFSNCAALTTVPQFNTSNVGNMSNMFSGCRVLTTLPLFDCGNVKDIGIFGYSGSTAIKHLGGFKDLGKQSSVSYTNGNYFLGACSNLTYESAMNVINNLYDRASAGYSVLTLKFHANVLALLSADDIAIATNKGWTIS